MDPDEVDPTQPHCYWPSLEHMGDCQVCGCQSDHPIHPRWTQAEIEAAKMKADELAAWLDKHAD